MMQTVETPEPIRRALALTARGEAVVTLIRLSRQLADLDTADRAYVAPMLADLASDVTTAQLAEQRMASTGPRTVRKEEWL